MRSIIKTAALALAIILPGSAIAQSSIEDFVKRATYGEVRISPDGKHLALISDRGDQDVLTVVRTRT